jgi:hypothetical protein
MSLDRIYREQARRRRWERYRDPRDAPDDDGGCAVCGLPLDDHWLATCPETADPACNPIDWDGLLRSGDPADDLDPVHDFPWLDSDDRALDARREDTP